MATIYSRKASGLSRGVQANTQMILQLVACLIAICLSLPNCLVQANEITTKLAPRYILDRPSGQVPGEPGRCRGIPLMMLPNMSYSIEFESDPDESCPSEIRETTTKLADEPPSRGWINIIVDRPGSNTTIDLDGIRLFDNYSIIETNIRAGYSNTTIDFKWHPNGIPRRHITRELNLINIDFNLAPPNYDRSSCFYIPLLANLSHLRIIKDLPRRDTFSTKTICRSPVFGNQESKFELSPEFNNELIFEHFKYVGIFLLENPIKLANRSTHLIFSHLNDTRDDYLSPDAFIACKPEAGGYINLPGGQTKSNTITFKNVVYDSLSSNNITNNSTTNRILFHRCIQSSVKRQGASKDLDIVEMDFERFFANANNDPIEMEMISLRELTNINLLVRHIRNDLPENDTDYNTLRIHCNEAPICHLFSFNNLNLIEAKCKLYQAGRIISMGHVDEALRSSLVRGCKAATYSLTLPYSNLESTNKINHLLVLLVLLVGITVGYYFYQTGRKATPPTTTVLEASPPPITLQAPSASSPAMALENPQEALASSSVKLSTGTEQQQLPAPANLAQ